MNKTLIIFALALNACASTATFGPTYTTLHGLKVFDQTKNIRPTQVEIETVTAYVIEKVGDTNLNGTRVFLTNDWVNIPQPDGSSKFMDGYTDITEKVIVASVFQSCFADSGLVHELFHIIHDQIVPDWWHEDTLFWERVKQLELDIIKDLCPSDYQRKEIQKPNK